MNAPALEREVGLSLGSNLGDRETHLRAARAKIVALPDVRLVACSPLYETEPVGVRPEYQHLKYLNAVLIVAAPWPAPWWLERLHEIETALGRIRTEDRNAPRTVDVDLLYCGDEILDNDVATVPHPRWASRRFVVQPLADVRPNLRLPGQSQTVAEILASLGASSGEVRRWKNEW
jgi:2-amino-4-hydroxy-6-hydroxymethyldihydropteridine diphosphokinase